MADTATPAPTPTQPSDQLSDRPPDQPEALPLDRSGSTPGAALTAAAITGVVAAAALSWDRPGVGWLLTALVAAGAVVAVMRGAGRGIEPGRASKPRLLPWTVAVGILLAVGAVRAAGWLFVLCVVSAALIACVVLTDRWSVGGLLLAPVRVAGSAPAALRRLMRGRIRLPRQDHHTLVRALAAGLVTVALLLVFGFLLAGADAAFAQVLRTMVRSVDRGTLLRWACSAAVAVTATATAIHAFLNREAPAETGSRLRLVRRLEWAVPVGGLVTLFAGYVAVQATVLFGGGDHVLATAGLTYAEYARSGFWQLLAVTGLTVVVVGVAARIAPRGEATDRVLLRTLLGLLSALTLVIVGSALSRMAAYEQAYGFTRLRLLVTACELWLGVVFLLILVAGIRLRGRWVPRAALAAAATALIGLAVLNPDAFIARHNADRFAETGRIDVDYLRTLSADAVPELQSLPEPYRSCALTAIRNELTGSRPETWLDWNLARRTARARLRDHPAAVAPCPW